MKKALFIVIVISLFLIVGCNKTQLYTIEEIEELKEQRMAETEAQNTSASEESQKEQEETQTQQQIEQDQTDASISQTETPQTQTAQTVHNPEKELYIYDVERIRRDYGAQVIGKVKNIGNEKINGFTIYSQVYKNAEFIAEGYKFHDEVLEPRQSKIFDIKINVTDPYWTSVLVSTRPIVEISKR